MSPNRYLLLFLFCLLAGGLILLDQSKTRLFAKTGIVVPVQDGQFDSPISPLPSATPTISPTPTVTATATLPFTITPTASPTATVTPTLTAQATATPTATPTINTVRVAGKVVDNVSGAGIADVLMMLASSDPLTKTTVVPLSTGSVYTTVTDLQGIFVFPAVPLGSYLLSGEKAGTTILTPSPLTINADQPVQMPPVEAIIPQPKVYLPLVER